MTESELKSGYKKICQLLSAKKLKQAFSQIRNLVAETGQGVYADQIYDLEQTYSYLRKYTVNGIDDPERGKIYNHLMISVFELADKVHENQMAKYAQSFFYREKRSSESFVLKNPDDFAEGFTLPQDQDNTGYSAGDSRKRNQISSESWRKIITLFYHIVFLDKLSNKDKTFISAIFEADSVIPEFKSILITALTFSLLRYFDEAKLELHLDLYDNNHEIVLIRQRCLTGFLIALYHYDYRIEFYPKIGARLELMNEDPSFSRNAGTIILQLIGSKETEKIGQKIRDEILPEMIRISPNIRNKLNFDNLMDEGASDDRNPEWTEIFSESPGLMEKMEEMAKMQIEGADVFLSSFSMLKSFPFFNEFTNWFIPFFPGHPEISFITTEDPEGSGTSITGSLLNSPILCNSDKYSFSLMLQSINSEGRAMMAGVLKAEMEQMKEISSDEDLLSPDRKSEIISNQYIQDLYRFYRLHPSKNDFDDIFSWKFDFHNKTGFRNIIDNYPEMIDKMAEFYFEKHYFQEALEIYGKSEDQNVENLQKGAYCHQKLGNYEKALSLYRKAELFDINKIWNLKKIALCYRNLKLPEEALKVYQTIDSLEPDNLNIIYAIGYCFSETGKYQDALNCFFKIEYLSPGNKKVWRPIAWFSLLTGKKEQAEKYYNKLMDDHPERYDLMNMGHVQWALAKRESALGYYRQSMGTGGFSEKDFMTAFDEDLHVLIAQGIIQDEIPIMLDQLRYSLEE
jgi:tetratricopeptide (TPR) repeat protein